MTSNPWHPMTDYKPCEYVLVNILLDDEVIRPGWWTGQTWDGRRTIDDDHVVGWRVMNPFVGRPRA